jgi:hypothetical protein
MFEDLFAYDVDELDEAAVLTAAAESRAQRERLEVLDLLHALQVADLHHDPRPGPTGPGRERRHVYGGAGCPAIAEFAPIELGAVMAMSPPAAKAYMSDAQDLRHRLPFTFARVLAGDADVWKARKIARATRALPEQAAALVDERVAAIVNSVTPVRLDTIVEAALWEADPAAAQAAAEEHARSRGVWVRRSDDHGTKSFYVRAAAGDVIRFDATIDDIAQALRTLGDTDTLDLRRAKAIGIIADPALAHELLEVAHLLAKTHTNTTTSTTTTDTGGDKDAPRHNDGKDGRTASRSRHGGHGEDEGAASGSGDDHSGDNTPSRGHDGQQGSDGDAACDGDDCNGVAGDSDDRHDGDDGAASGVCGDGHVADNTPGRDGDGREGSAREEDACDGDGDGSVGGGGAGSSGGSDSGSGCGFDAGADDWYLADEPGPDDEADRDAPHPSSSDLADPLDTAGRVLAEPWRGDEEQSEQTGQGEPAMDVFSRRVLAGKLAEIKQAAYATGLGAGSRRGPGNVIAYVHLTDKTLATGQGVLRVEEHGPMVAGQLSELLGHDQVVVKPVIDLNDRVSVDAYEIPERIRERVKLIHPVEQFVYGTAETTMRTDLDHTEAYDPNGPPGQTNTENLAPLARFSHRLKTHGGWAVRRLDDGAQKWVSPHGFKFRVDHTGSHPLRTADIDDTADDIADTADADSADSADGGDAAV